MNTEPGSKRPMWEPTRPIVWALERKNVSAHCAGLLATRGLFDLQADGAKAIGPIYLDRENLALVRYSVQRIREKFANVPIASSLWGQH